MKLKENFEILLNGKVILRGHNDIDTDLRAYFRDQMKSSVDKAINNLFSVYGEAFGGTQDGKDGIVIQTTEDGVETMDTSTLSPNATYGFRWRGEWTNESGSNRSVTSFGLGRNFNSGSAYNAAFGTQYGFISGSGYQFTASNQDTVIMRWEIFIA